MEIYRCGVGAQPSHCPYSISIGASGVVWGGVGWCGARALGVEQARASAVGWVATMVGLYQRDDRGGVARRKRHWMPVGGRQRDGQRRQIACRCTNDFGRAYCESSTFWEQIGTGDVIKKKAHQAAFDARVTNRRSNQGEPEFMGGWA